MRDIKFTDLARRQLRSYNLRNKNIKLVAILDAKADNIMYLANNIREAELVVSFAEEFTSGSKIQAKLKDLEFIEVPMSGLKKLLST